MEFTFQCPHCMHKNQVIEEEFTKKLCSACGQPLYHTPSSTGPSGTAEEQVKQEAWINDIGDEKKQREYVEKGFWKKMKKFAAKVPFTLDAVSMYYCAIDPKTPAWAKVKAFGALAYFILPTDAIPDFLPIAGFTDDAGALYFAYKSISQHVTEEHREQAKQWMNG